MIFNDEAFNKQIPSGLAVWDDRPRFLGMFASYDVPPDKKDVYMFGIGDHLVTCRGCASRKGGVHPTLHTLFAYFHTSGKLFTVSWPTWAKI